MLWTHRVRRGIRTLVTTLLSGAMPGPFPGGLADLPGSGRVNAWCCGRDSNPQAPCGTHGPGPCPFTDSDTAACPVKPYFLAHFLTALSDTPYFRPMASQDMFDIISANSSAEGRSFTTQLRLGSAFDSCRRLQATQRPLFDCRVIPFHHLGLAPTRGFEPLTLRVTAACTTVVLRRNVYC